MCNCMYLEDLSIIANLDQKQESLVQQLFFRWVARRIAVPFGMFMDARFAPGWEEELKKSGDVFAITHNICAQLLEAIENQ